MITLLKNRLAHPLPGLEAQLELSSRNRGIQWKVRHDHKMSGVLVLLYPHEAEWHLVLMKRSEDGRAHSGQISFPGGRMELSDPDVAFTALRETEEELGVSIDKVDVLGHMTELYIPVSNYMVVPTIGVTQHRPLFIPNKLEVAEVIEISLEKLIQPASRISAEVSTRSGFQMEVPAFDVHGHVVWGATAMMLNELLIMVREFPSLRFE